MFLSTSGPCHSIRTTLLQLIHNPTAGVVSSMLVVIAREFTFDLLPASGTPSGSSPPAPPFTTHLRSLKAKLQTHRARFWRRDAHEGDLVLRANQGAFARFGGVHRGLNQVRSRRNGLFLAHTHLDAVAVESVSTRLPVIAGLFSSNISAVNTAVSCPTGSPTSPRGCCRRPEIGSRPTILSVPGEMTCGRVCRILSSSG